MQELTYLKLIFDITMSTICKSCQRFGNLKELQLSDDFTHILALSTLRFTLLVFYKPSRFAIKEFLFAIHFECANFRKEIISDACLDMTCLPLGRGPR